MTLFDIIEAAEPVASPAKKEKRRLHAANLRVLAFLQQRAADGATNWELTAPDVGGCEGMKRLRELRAWGYEIRGPVKAEGKGTTRYFYEGIKAL